MSVIPTTALKIVDGGEWATALAQGRYRGSAVDLADGYIHMSTENQLTETARRHYAGRGGLRLLTVDLTRLGDGLIWEPSRGGALFPHLYGPLPTSTVIADRALSVADDGSMAIDEDAAT